jgi:hypothetical protein
MAFFEAVFKDRLLGETPTIVAKRLGSLNKKNRTANDWTIVIVEELRALWYPTQEVAWPMIVVQGTLGLDITVSIDNKRIDYGERRI